MFFYEHQALSQQTIKSDVTFEQNTVPKLPTPAAVQARLRRLLRIGSLHELKERDVWSDSPLELTAHEARRRALGEAVKVRLRFVAMAAASVLDARLALLRQRGVHSAHARLQPRWRRQ